MQKIIIIVVFTFFACQKNGVKETGRGKQASSQQCIDQSKINKEANCIMNYDPVCGCDEKTYSNSCVAENAGVTKYVKGECK